LLNSNNEKLFHYIMSRTSYIRYYDKHHQTNKHLTALKRFLTLCFVMVFIIIVDLKSSVELVFFMYVVICIDSK